jgi:phosphoribosyl-AMP cyclohydrolase
MAKSDPSSEPDFAKGGGILPAVVQDRASGAVLMLAYMNAEAYRQTLASRRGVFYSRSRQKLWVKGEESGHYQQVQEVYLDCDRDTILLVVDQTGAACHEGYPTCFYRRVTEEGLEIVQERVFDPAEVYFEEREDEGDR